MTVPGVADARVEADDAVNETLTEHSGRVTAFRGDDSVDGLTDEQRIASGTPGRSLFIEAGPGTGKTTVSAYRFGVQRYRVSDRLDPRAVVAVSFTRAATWNLWRRVQRIWGRSAVVWPHRIITLDTVMSDLLHDLLGCDLVRWPNGSHVLDIHDSWASFSGTVWTRTAYDLRLVDGNVEIVSGYATTRGARVPTTVIVPLLEHGVCTHEDVRRILGQALLLPDCVERLRSRLAATMRTMIVDEIFDANDLDLDVIGLAIEAGVSVTLVGDPWQALYLFRGAKPERVNELIRSHALEILPLTRSFRWRTDTQRDLADELRSGHPALLPVDASNGRESDVDVVLALFWKPLWEIGPEVLPLAFHAFKGGIEEAAATLLLNHVTRHVFSEDATYLRDALTALAIIDQDVPRQLEGELQRVVELLRVPGKPALNAAYNALVAVIGEVSRRPMRPAHVAHTVRLAEVSKRVLYQGRPVPGLTTHQAKGREWDVVGVRLSASERGLLAAGLRVDEDTHRKLYVACTRARYGTVEV